MVTLMSLCASNLLLQQNQLSPWNAGSTSKPLVRNNRCYQGRQRSRLVVLAITKGSAKSSKSDEKIPSWARPDSDEAPPWARDGKKGSSESTVQIPYVGYLLASSVTAIAAIGSIFEYVNKKPVFGLLNSDSIFYAPLLGFFVFTGIPTSRIVEQRWCKLDMLIGDTCHQLSISTPSINEASRINRRSSFSLIARSGSSTSSEGSQSDSKLTNKEKVSFGNSRKDVILIGVGVTIAGFALKYGLEFVGVDPLQAGNAVQLIFVLALTIGWISSYMFRVANKDMTYAQQLKDYEKKVMEKRVESLSEAELEALLEQVEEEKGRLGKQ